MTAGPITQLSTSEAAIIRRSAVIRRISVYRTLASTGYIISSSPSAMGRLVPWIATLFSALFRPGTRQPSSSPAAIAAPIHTGRNRSSRDSRATTGRCLAAAVTWSVLVSVTTAPLVVLAWRPAPLGGHTIAGQRHTGGVRLSPHRGEPVAVKAVVNPAAAARRGHQPGLAQHPQMIGEQVRRDRHLFVQVAHAALTLGQDAHDAQAHRISQRRETVGELNRARINNR